jgi:hypothetical protein
MLAFRTPPANLDKAEVDGKRHVIFMSYYPYASLVKKSCILRQTGRYYTTMLACCLREDTAPLRCFDQAYEVEDYNELLRLVSSCAPVCLHALIHPWIFGALAVVAKRTTGVRAVIDINDSKLFMDHDAASPECVMEQRILQEADAFSHKMPEEAIHEMRETWDLATPDALIHSLPLQELFQQSQPYSGEGPLRLVFAGGIMPQHIAKAQGHEGHLFDPLITKVSGMDCLLTFYVNQNARNMYWEEHQKYLDFQSECSNFRFLKGVPLFSLPERLSAHHFGVYYENSRASSYNPKHFKYNMATKIFSYLEAGLPVLVPETAEYIRDFLVQYGMGIPYCLESLDEVIRRISRLDHETILSNVRRFRDQSNMSAVTGTLEALYGAGCLENHLHACSDRIDHRLSQRGER